MSGPLYFLGDLSVLNGIGFVEEKLYAREYLTYYLKFDFDEGIRIWADNKEISFYISGKHGQEKIISKMICSNLEEFRYDSVYSPLSWYRFVIDNDTEELLRFDRFKHDSMYCDDLEKCEEIDWKFDKYVISVEDPLISLIQEFYKLGYIDPFKEGV